jgi:hypothetical protein
MLGGVASCGDSGSGSGGSGSGGSGTGLVPSPGSGTPCVVDDDCPGGERCNLGLAEPVCTTLRSVGEGGPCATDLCETGLSCFQKPPCEGLETRVCMVAGTEPTGAACCVDPQCAEGTCGAYSTCEGEPGANGSPCAADAECGSSYCYVHVDGGFCLPIVCQSATLNYGNDPDPCPLCLFQTASEACCLSLICPPGEPPPCPTQTEADACIAGCAECNG